MSLFVGKLEVVGNKLATYSQIMEKKKNLYIILANFYEFEIVSRKKIKTNL